MKIDINNTDKKYKTILIDPPWRYGNRTGKSSPEHKRLKRYETMNIEELKEMRDIIKKISDEECHMYMWCTWSMMNEGLELMKEYGFEYKTGIPWLKVAKNGEPDGRCMGFYGRVVTEFMLFGVKSKKSKSFRTKPPHNKKNIIIAPKREHSRKPDEQYEHIESKSYEPYIELFARNEKENWDRWGDEA